MVGASIGFARRLVNALGAKQALPFWTGSRMAAAPPPAPAHTTLFDRVPPRPGTPPEDLLDLFLGYVQDVGLSLYPAQEQAILELFSGNNVILATPTGSGKSLVALAFHFFAMSAGRRSYYTAPIKALVSEKFFALCGELGAEHVGMITGDASVNRDAPIICCTAEIVANMALREGRHAPVDCLVIDEFHYYADRDRGLAWQIPLLVLEHAQFLLMSATFGPSETFEKTLTKLTKRRTVTVRSVDRPVPLTFEYRETPLHETIIELARAGRTPIYVVNFTQRAAAETAQDLMSMDLTTKDRKRVLAAELASSIRFDTPYGKELKRFLAHGIGIHHAGLLPKYRRLVEKLAQKGLLAVVSGTDTLGVGVNIPIRSVLFTQLCKFDGEKTALLGVREFQQIAGRAGRKGFDDRGDVVVQAPAHVIENIRLEQKAAGDRVKTKRLVRKKPPDRGYLHWDRMTFDRLVTSQPEPLISRFRVSHGMILNVLESPNAGCLDVARIIYRSHERRAQRRIFGREAKAMVDTLMAAEIVEIEPDRPRKIRLHVDLQDDFSLHHALSLWLFDSIGLLDPESPTYGLDVTTLVESILENPDFVLRQQIEALKRVKLAELKMAGVEYEQRIEELEKLEHPKPLRDLVYDSFNAFARAHPWVRGDDVRPKSIAREMVERFMDFNEYVREYELGRAEGTLLRYLTDAYKALVQTVPAPAKTPQVDEIVVFLRAIVRSVDSSLLDEWERMRSGALEPGPDDAGSADVVEGDVTRDERAFTVLVRAAMFRLIRALSRKDWAAAASMVSTAPDDEPWTAERFAQSMAPFFEAHAAIRTDARARAPDRTLIRKSERGTWGIVQVISDVDEDDDWTLSAFVDLDVSAREGKAVVVMGYVSR
jgi:superfamily II RNA helicase